MTESTSVLMNKIKGSLWGVYIGDALAMPAHWFYDTSLFRLFPNGKIDKYVDAPIKLPGSIMNLSNTDGGGRGSDKGDLIGSYICHGKKKYWMRGGDYHYHQGMKAGENTLEALITRIVTRSIINNKDFDVNKAREDYVQFMITPNSHNDTYIGTNHRMFFANHKKGRLNDECCDNDGHNVDAIDGLVNLPPVVFNALMKGKEKVKKDVELCTKLTRKTDILPSFGNIYADLLIDLVNGKDSQKAIEESAAKIGFDVKRSARSSDPMTACYITSSFPALLHYAYKYANNMEQGLLNSTNAGGENVARGAALGAIFGAIHGFDNIPKWMINGLHDHDEIDKEINQLISKIESEMKNKL